jgi:hypothetical protein
VREQADLPGLPPKLVPLDETATTELAQRTLTNLYNDRPTWLSDLHRNLDAAVFAAYGWSEANDPDSLGDEGMLKRLLELNLKRARMGE